MRQVEGDAEDLGHYIFYMKFYKPSRHVKKHIVREDLTFILEGLPIRQFESLKSSCEDITLDFIETGEISQVGIESGAIENSA